jgi:hypothetical protein
MRVKGTLGLLLVILLALCMLAPAAGALYIPGQPTPNDGLMHIMADGNDLGTAAPAGMPADDGLTAAIPLSAIPAGLLDDSYGLETGLPAGFPSTLVDSIQPAMLPYEGLVTMPLTTVPSGDVNLVSGDVVGKTISPTKQNFLDFADLGGFQTNMPVLNSIFA